MDVYKELQSFLLGTRDYSHGLKIFSKIKPGSPLIKLLQKEDEFSRSKLISELEAYFKTLPTPKKEFKSYTKSKLAGSIDPEILPEELKLEYFKLSPYIREISHHHSQLKITSSDQERLTRASRIIELANLRRGVFIRCDYFMEHGKVLDLPDTTPIEKPKPELTKEILEAKAELILKRSMRSKLKNKPNRIKDYVATCDRIKFLENLINGTNETERTAG